MKVLHPTTKNVEKHVKLTTISLCMSVDWRNIDLMWDMWGVLSYPQIIPYMVLCENMRINLMNDAIFI